MGRLRIVRDVCQGVLGRYEVVVKEGEARLREYERWGEGPSVDELVCAGSVVHNQSVSTRQPVVVFFSVSVDLENAID